MCRPAAGSAGSATLRSCLSLLLLLFATLASGGARAFVDRISPGERVELDADEGLLLVAVDSSTNLRSVKLKRLDGFFTTANIRRLESGRTAALYALPAGEYQWIQVRTFAEIQYDLADDPEYRFTVRPGRINYAGDLVVRPQSVFTTLFHVTNRGLAGIDWLRKEHRPLAESYAFEYTGHYPDPFPAFYAEAVRHQAPREARRKLATPSTEAGDARRKLIEALWRTPRLSLLRMSPDGLLVAQAIVEDDKVRVEVHETDTGRTTTVLEPVGMVSELVWADDGRLVVSSGREPFLQWVSVVFVKRGKDDARSYEEHTLSRLGHIVDVVRGQSPRLLFGTNGAGGELVVVSLSIATPSALGKFRFDPRARLNQGIEGDRAWLADAQGRLRIALVHRDGKRLLVERGLDGTLRDLLELETGEAFAPFALSPDGTSFYAVTDRDREQRELVSFDLASRRIGRTIFAKPGYDIVDVHTGPDGRPIGVVWYDDGAPVTEFFDGTDAEALARVRAAFGDATVLVQDRDAAGRRLVLGVEPQGRPLERHVWDTKTGRATLIARSRPWLDKTELSPTSVLRAVGKDGFALEAFLTVPRGDGPRPLVVMPHGGPIGVRDTLHFDPAVQFVASLGYAVLRVNFRGSDGYGRRFREGGHGKLGTAIEDDVEAAIAAALEDPRVDRERLCAVGASYGGFSALVSAVRSPDRFRCVVSIAGVSDRILFFTASDGGRSETGRAELERALGNPREELDAMRDSSPLYRYADLVAPVLLIHGAEDFRVDFEHTLRMARMLALAGRPPAVIQLASAGHAIVDDENLVATWHATATFLDTYLGSAGAATGSAASGAASR